MGPFGVNESSTVAFILTADRAKRSQTIQKDQQQSCPNPNLNLLLLVRPVDCVRLCRVPTCPGKHGNDRHSDTFSSLGNPWKRFNYPGELGKTETPFYLLWFLNCDGNITTLPASPVQEVSSGSASSGTDCLCFLSSSTRSINTQSEKVKQESLREELLSTLKLKQHN